MRLVPVLTAILVAATLFVVVLHRDALIAFANGASFDEAVAIARGEAPAPGDTTDETASADTDGAAEAKAAEADATDAGPKPVRVIALHSTAQVVDGAVLLRGETQAFRQVELRAETSGRMISNPLRKGASITAGEVICALDPGTREASLAEAEARLAEARAAIPTAKARVEEARAGLEEAKLNQNAAVKLAEGGYASDTRVASVNAAERSAEAAVASAESGLATVSASIQAAEASVAAATREIERLTIMAPFAGLLESDTAELGALLQTGGLCATIIQLDPIKLVAYIPETQVNRVSLGARAGARLATGGADIIGTVSFLSKSADPQTRTFLVEIEVPNPGLLIRDGQTVEIGIEAAGAQAHLLPQSALTLDDDGALGVRIVAADDTAKFVPVRLLRDTPRGVWVTGLAETADVIIIGQEYVVTGVPVLATFEEPTQ
ncbi:efflux RND transporter periplasmic adaptor subunit [Pseudooceanicola sp.]|uniref:efflux RND transporter periplasmic adaptor subunit n=1 Tax=Pseudooceanicola sp. TaxID=1914328 RepID=UPI00261DD7CB|nr:efflux RND transporter periplasmic adaptor subunit [Pseudooceanicola sp.]MDF1856891.1 efflux RND transporter periplasmic adaptor subunit [Pseudooceanicola sp.]